MELEKVPQIIPLLEKNGVVISAEQKVQIQAELTKSNEAGHKPFVGEIAVRLGIVTQEQLDNALLEQALEKAKAAYKDVKTIQTTQKPLPIAPENQSWLKANWGNDGVNPAEISDKPQKRLVIGAIAAANIAQNLAMMANAQVAAHPELVNDAYVDAVYAAGKFARGLANRPEQGEQPIILLANQWAAQMEAQLDRGAAVSGPLKGNWSDKPITIDEFGVQRFQEMANGFTQQFAIAQESKSAGHTNTRS